ncbi:MAG: peptidylprolyl isomerase [Candidatus Kapabacteria bacterium]|nr:peptidylprolyl isomerase [Candidatus Kapabacteria bacterium]MDW8011671.1 peptidylprolyl isomerase [Bacteroidota bacterium]
MGLRYGLWIVVAATSSTLCIAAQQVVPKKTKARTIHISRIEQQELATVGPEKITYRELEQAYRRNTARQHTRLYEVPRDSVESFLRLYINYRLKVLDALSRGLDKDSAFLREFENHRRLLAETYFFDKRLVEPAVEELLRRRQSELRLAIMLFSQNFDQDTLPAYERAKRAIALLQQGVPFETLARDSSDDRETAQQGGILPFITGGMVLRPIEDVAYQLKPGQFYPAPIRTRHGYFVVKLLQREPRVAVLARHILLPIVNGDTAAALAKADSLLQLLRSGADFAEIARQNSIDNVTAERGGSFGSWYTRSLGFENIPSRLLPEFENALFSIPDGGLTVTVTSFGVHIIRRDSTKRYAVEEERETLRRLYRRLYFEEDRQRFLDSVRTAWGCQWNTPVYQAFVSSIDTTNNPSDTAWATRIPTALLDQPIYLCRHLQPVTVRHLIDTLSQPFYRTLPLRSANLLQTVQRATTPAIVDYLSRGLERQDPEFARLLREFRDGLLLFRVEDQEVWSKLSRFDTVAARAYYDTTKHRYYTEPVYDLSEIYVTSDSLARTLRAQLDAGADFAKLAEQYTQRPGYREKKGHWGKLTPKQNKLAALAEQQQAKKGDIIGPLPYENGFVLLRINDYEPPRQKGFEEAIPDFAPAFQELQQQRLTEQWLERLRQRFPVKINTAALAAIWGLARRR